MRSLPSPERALAGAVLVLLGLLFWSVTEGEKWKQIAMSKPEVKEIVREDSTQAKETHRHEERGKVTVVTKYVTGTCGKPEVSEKIVTRDPVDVALDQITENTKRLEKVREEHPACPEFPRRFAGPIGGPVAPYLYGGYGGLTVGRFDLSAGVIRSPLHHEIVGFGQAALRF